MVPARVRRTLRRSRCVVLAHQALGREDAAKRYVDLRTLKTVRWEDAHLTRGAAPGCRFGPFNAAEGMHVEVPASVVFSEDTVALSEVQKEVVRAVLSRRSVVHASCSSGERLGIVVDLASRAAVWKQRVVYCAVSRRAAQAMYATLVAQIGSDGRHAVLLDIGDVAFGAMESDALGAENANAPTVVITLPHVLRRHLVDPEASPWMQDTDLVFLDNILSCTPADWEEIMLTMPSRVVMCVFAGDVPTSVREQLPLWLETVQNSVVPVTAPGASSLLDRIDRPVNVPLIRMFAFNAAVHDAPVQISLALLVEALKMELAEPVGHGADVNYASSFLHGVKMMPALSPASLLFTSADEAEYADVACLLLADAKSTAKAVHTKSRKRATTKKRKSRTAASLAAARRRREAANSESLLFPALVMVHGREETESAAFAVLSASTGVTSLLWDDDSKAFLEELVDRYRSMHEADLGDKENDVLDALKQGIGIVHGGTLPALRLLVEELFQGGLIPALFVDTFLGPLELQALPQAKTVILQSSALAESDDALKGLIKGSSAASLAGRQGKDDTGNLIVMWYDESIEDAEAGSVIAGAVLAPVLAEREGAGSLLPVVSAQAAAPWATARHSSGSGLETLIRQTEQSNRNPANRSFLWSSFGGVLRSLRRFGIDGYKSMLDYAVESHQGWLMGATLRASREKLELEKLVLDERMDTVDWAEVASHDRREAKLSEAKRVLDAMHSRRDAVVHEKMFSELKRATPGTTIGLVAKTNALSAGADDNGEQESEHLLMGVFDNNTGGLSATNGNVPATESGMKHDNLGDSKTSASIALGAALGEGQVSMLPAVLVGVFDRSKQNGQAAPLKDNQLVLCIMVDGIWTLVPMNDVIAVGQVHEPRVLNVDLLEAPHLATFDIDPSTQWAKCRPVVESEMLSLGRVSDQLVQQLTSENAPVLRPLTLPEYEKQKTRVSRAREIYKDSVWAGRESELAELRRLRRRSVALADDAATFRKSESRLETVLYRSHYEHLSGQQARLAVLEDCNAVSIQGVDEMEMTPIGALASVVPGPYPLFCAACLLLVDGVEDLSPAQFTAFVSVIVSHSGHSHKSRGLASSAPASSVVRSKAGVEDMFSTAFGGDELERGFSTTTTAGNSNKTSKSHTPLIGLSDVDELEDVLPTEMMTAFDEIHRALHMLQQRHMSGKDKQNHGTSSRVAPARLNTGSARWAHLFASGGDWCKVVRGRGLEGGDVVREMSTVVETVSIVADGGAIGEFSENVRETARRTLAALRRWPLYDGEDLDLVLQGGVIERHAVGCNYDKWWRGAQPDVEALVAATVAKGGGEVIESVEAEVVE